CDSAGAGLVTLGVMRRCLEMDDANDASAHYRRLCELARQQGEKPALRHRRMPGVFKFDGFYPNGDPRVRRQKSRQDETRSIPSTSACEWDINGEPHVVLPGGEQVPNAQLYSRLVPGGGEINPNNLGVSHSEVCLVGHNVGESATKRGAERIRFREGSLEAGLAQLLTVHGWAQKTVSRVNFYNSRTKKFDREYIGPRIAITDGDASFLGVVEKGEFRDSHVIGVIDRTADRTKLEGVGNKLGDLRQWYEDCAPARLPAPPRGIGLVVMERRPG
ncbi:MAG: hypothetical protein ACP5M4_15225, partial [Acidobacteriaceae bacterium]